MCPDIVVVANELGQEALQVPLIQHDHMVEQIASATADEALGDAVLLRASEGRSLGLDPKALHCVNHIATEVCAAIKDQVSGRGIKRECLTQLMNHPGARRVLCHIEVKDVPPVVRNHEEAVENAEAQCWHREEIHRCNCFSMIAQKRRPSLGRLRTPRSFPHPAQHRSLRKLEAKHLQFTVSARHSPCRVLGDPLKDEFPHLLADALPARGGSMP
jgi:hypothetical protein